jgi:transaldolase
MKFFVDTADVAEITELAATGLLDGVTTNPSLVAKSGRNFFQVIEEICALVDGPVSAEVAATAYERMLAEGRRLADLAENVCVKLPLTWDGLKACKTLTQDGIQTNVTLCFTPAQALLAAKAGATFVSPFVGRLDDIGHDGMALIGDIVEIFRNYLCAQPGPRDRGRAARRRRRDPAAQGPAPAHPAPADRQGPRRLPQGLGGDRPEDRRLSLARAITPGERARRLYPRPAGSC